MTLAPLIGIDHSSQVGARESSPRGSAEVAWILRGGADKVSTMRELTRTCAAALLLLAGCGSAIQHRSPYESAGSTATKPSRWELEYAHFRAQADEVQRESLARDLRRWKEREERTYPSVLAIEGGRREPPTRRPASTAPVGSFSSSTAWTPVTPPAFTPEAGREYIWVTPVWTGAGHSQQGSTSGGGHYRTGASTRTRSFTGRDDYVSHDNYSGYRSRTGAHNSNTSRRSYSSQPQTGDRAGRTVYVRGHYRNGSWVRPHYRSPPRRGRR